MGAISIRAEGGNTSGILAKFATLPLTVNDATKHYQKIPTATSSGYNEYQSITSIRTSGRLSPIEVEIDRVSVESEHTNAPFVIPNTITFNLGSFTLNSTGASAQQTAGGTLSVENSGITLGSGWYQPLAIAVNGLQLKIPTNNWTTYNNLQNTQTNIGVDLQGLVTTTEINSSDSIPITFAYDTTVYMVRQTNWNGVDITGWTSIGNAGNIIQDSSTDEAVYERTFTAGTYNFDNNSAMYFFNPDRTTTIPPEGLLKENYSETTTYNTTPTNSITPYVEYSTLEVSNGIFPVTTPSERITLKTSNEVRPFTYFTEKNIFVRKSLISNLPDDGFFDSQATLSIFVPTGNTPFDLFQLSKQQYGQGFSQYIKARVIDSTGNSGGTGGGTGSGSGPVQSWSS